MAKRKTSEKQNGDSSLLSDLKQFFTSNATLFSIGLIIFIFSIYAFIAMLSFFYTGAAADQSKIEEGIIDGVTNWMGINGAILSDILVNKGFGVSTFFLLFFLAFVGLRLMKVKYVNLIKYFIICSILTIWTSITISFLFGPFFKDTAYFIGGAHGSVMSGLMEKYFGYPGTFMILIVVIIILMAIISSRTIIYIQRLFKWKPKPGKGEKETKEVKEVKEIKEIKNIKEEKTESTGLNSDIDFVVCVPDPDDDPKPSSSEIISFEDPPFNVNLPEDDNEYNEIELLGVYDPTVDLSIYKYPPIDLLKRYDQGETQVDMEEQKENKNKITQTLNNFGISIKSIKATVGPTVTLYEIIPEDGVRITKIRNLEDDIAMNLSALGIRIIAPMPGKGTVGIEVPNKDPQIVSMHSIISSRKFHESGYDLPIALGRTITNEVFMIDLTKTPHLLVAGATGQGKSVGLNAAITSLLYKKHPAELKFVLIDPKMVEFSIYSTIEKHFLAKLPDAEKPIITDFTKVIYTLNSLTKEMDDRYELLEKAGSRNVKEYNEKFINRRLNPNKGHRFMPYIVVIIDEFGDLIMTACKEIEQPIARIAQKARAV